MTEPLLFFKSVTRRYGAVVGLNEVSVSVGPGITGLVGPNAAGKTTFIALSVGLRRPTTGFVSLLGTNPVHDLEVRRKLGYCPDGDRLWDKLSGLEFVSTMGELAGLSASQSMERSKEVLTALALQDAWHRPVATYSRGMRQKVKVAQSVLHRPRFLMLDEPLNGVDPLSRHEILKLLESLAKEGTAVVISSHVLHELDGFVDNVLLLHRGRLLASGGVEEIRDLIYEHPHSIKIQCDAPNRLAKEVLSLPGLLALELEERCLTVRTSSPAELYRALPSLVLALGVQVDSMHSPDSNLEAVFRYLTKGDL